MACVQTNNIVHTSNEAFYKIQMRHSTQKCTCCMNRRSIPTNRLPKLICFAALLFISVQILISHFTTDDDVLYFYGSGVNVSNHVIYFQSRDVRPKPKKLILIWTPMFFKWSLWSSAIETVQNCKNNCSCEMTTDTRRLEEADAILFHCMDLMPWTGFPKYRNPSQIWIVWCAEPPTKIWSSLSGYRYLFNWTMYYRSDSTVFAPFARFRRLEKHEIKKENSLLKSKRYGIALTNSNCFDDIQRYRLFDELKRYLKYDFYGSCGDLVCGRDDPKCHEKLLSYKFSIQFENSYCKDYVTEKYYDALQMTQLPIVNWKKGQMVYQVLPHSYININDFSSIKEAAEYIKKVDSNDTLYLSYFKWRKQYTITSSGVWRQFCFLCEALHNSKIPAQVIEDLNHWFSDDTCHKGSLFTIMRRVLYRFKYDLGM